MPNEPQVHQSDRQTEQPVSGGALGKLAGKAKQFAGTMLGSSELDREGRLQQVQAEAEQEAIERGEQADSKDAEAKLAIAKAETETERRELERELAQMSAEERIERDEAQAKRQAKAAHAEEIREAAGLERDANRAERAADVVDPDANR